MATQPLPRLPEGLHLIPIAAVLKAIEFQTDIGQAGLYQELPQGLEIGLKLPKKHPQITNLKVLPINLKPIPNH